MKIMQRVTVLMATVFFCTPLAKAAAPGRLDVSQAFGIMADEACREAFGDDEEAVQACLDDDGFGIDRNTNDDFFENDEDIDDEDSRSCVEAGGVISERMYECSQAMKAVHLAEARGERSGYFYALGDVAEFCSAKWLCTQ